MTEAEIIDHAREWIAGYKVPKSVEIRTEPLPLSGAMKVLKTGAARALLGRARPRRQLTGDQHRADLGRGARLARRSPRLGRGVIDAEVRPAQVDRAHARRAGTVDVARPRVADEQRVLAARRRAARACAS